MDARFYNSEEIDVERLGRDLVQAYLAQGYKAQQVGNGDQILVQLKKGGDFEAIIGMQAALSLTIQRTAGGVLAMIGHQRWLDKAAIGAVGIAVIPVLWPLAVTAGVGALRQASLGNQVLNMVDGLVRQQRPGLIGGPVPSQIIPQIQQQWAPPPYAQTPVYTPPPQMAIPQPIPQPMLPPPTSSQLRCTHCNTPYEAGDTFCTGCGRSLIAPKVYCANCNTELKAGLAFCPKCGSSTFTAQSATQQGQSRQAPAPATYTSAAPASPPPAPTYTPPPVYTPPPTPVYQPPTPVAPPTPVYQPPKQPTPPPAPVYTPPTPSAPANPPAPQVYYTPSQPAVSPHDEPTIAAEPLTQQPTQPYYVPPVTQEPPVKPQPKVTMIQSTPRQEPPPPQKAKPQKQYYIPSNPAQETMPATAAAQASADADEPTVVASTASASTTDTAWGTLAFSDGQQVQLKGEHAVIGRYDHDMGGIQPEVDLSKMPGADTVSRVHASLEHSGSSYILTDLNSTNATRINSKRIEPDKGQPVNDGDALQFGKVTCTFKKLA